MCTDANERKMYYPNPHEQGGRTSFGAEKPVHTWCMWECRRQKRSQTRMTIHQFADEKEAAGSCFVQQFATITFRIAVLTEQTVCSTTAFA